MNDYLQSKDFPEIPLKEYKIHSLIGRGAFSRVFLAYTADNQKVAIKRLRLTQRPASLLNELQFLRQLQCKPCIIQLKRVIFSETSLQTSIITSFLENSIDFKQQLYKFTPYNMQQYAFCLLTALSHLEGRILHRDVKPGNYLFSVKENRGILIDFGLAQKLEDCIHFGHLNSRDVQKSVSDSSSQKQQQMFSGIADLSSPKHHKAKNGQLSYSGTVSYPLPRLPTPSHTLPPPPSMPHAGTHGYRAPEILTQNVVQTTKIDVFGCGICLLMILTGKSQLFRDQQSYDIYELLCQRSFAGAERFILKMFQLRTDFQFSAGVPQPCSVFLEKLAYDCNPGLLVGLTYEFFALLRQMLEFDPGARISASRALESKFFRQKFGGIPYNNAFQSSAVQFLETSQMNQEAFELLKQRQADIICLNGDDFTQKSILKTFEDAKYQAFALNSAIRRGAEKIVQKYQLASRATLYECKVSRNAQMCRFERDQFTASNSQYARGNLRYIEEYYKTQETENLRDQLTAQRRKIDSQVLLVKAMNLEVLNWQRKIRQLAEEIRRESVKQLEKDEEQRKPGFCEADEARSFTRVEMVEKDGVLTERPIMLQYYVNIAGLFPIIYQQSEASTKLTDAEKRFILLITRQQINQRCQLALQRIIRKQMQLLTQSDEKFTFYSERFGDPSYFKQVEEIQTALKMLNSEIIQRQNRYQQYKNQLEMLREDDYSCKLYLLSESAQQQINRLLYNQEHKEHNIDSQQSDEINFEFSSGEGSDGGDKYLFDNFKRGKEIIHKQQQDYYQLSDFNSQSDQLCQKLLDNKTIQQNTAKFDKLLSRIQQKTREQQRRDFDQHFPEDYKQMPLILKNYEQVLNKNFLLQLAYSRFSQQLLQKIIMYQSFSNDPIVNQYLHSSLARKDAIIAISCCQTYYDEHCKKSPDLQKQIGLPLLVKSCKRSQSFMPGVPKSAQMKHYLQTEHCIDQQQEMTKRVSNEVKNLQQYSQQASKYPYQLLTTYKNQQYLKVINKFRLSKCEQSQNVKVIGQHMLLSLTNKNNKLHEVLCKGCQQYGSSQVFDIIQQTLFDQKRFQ